MHTRTLASPVDVRVDEVAPKVFSLLSFPLFGRPRANVALRVISVGAGPLPPQFLQLRIFQVHFPHSFCNFSFCNICADMLGIARDTRSLQAARNVKLRVKRGVGRGVGRGVRRSQEESGGVSRSQEESGRCIGGSATAHKDCYLLQK